ncbi:MAG: ABC transporter permease subunit [Actinomycetota bacterium]
MRALLAVELRRNFARRTLMALSALVFLAVTMAGLTVYLTHGNTTPAQNRALFARGFLVQQCVRGEVGPVELPQTDAPSDRLPLEPPIPAANSAGRQEFCMFDPRAGIGPELDFPKPYRYSSLDEAFMGISIPLLMLAWILAASFAGAEWRAGTMATLLTWEPRRLRVFTTKALAAIVVGVVVYVAAQVLLAFALLPAGLARGTMSGVDPDWVWSLAGVLARGTLLAAVGAGIGFAIGMIGRNTAAALGIGFVYLSLIDGGFLGAIIPRLRPWLFVGNSIVWVGGKTELGIIEGRTPAQAALIVATYGLVSLVIAAAVFQRRDVT